MNQISQERPPSHFCGLVVARMSPLVLGEVEFLVIEYKKSGPKQIKFVGGTSKGGERPFLDMIPTLRREAMEELGDPQLSQKHQVAINLSDEVLAGRLVAETKKGPTHTQYFYMVGADEIGGTLRQRVVWDDDEELSSPHFVGGKELFRNIFPSHFVALVSTIVKLSEISDDVKVFHSDTLNSARTIRALAQQ